MVKQNKTKRFILIGYRARGISLYKTKIKPLGYVVAALGFGSLAVAVFPNGLGFVMYPLGFALLGLVGIKLNIKRKVADKIRFFKYKRGLI